MRFKQLDLNLLVALDHMLALRSVSQAADRMNMSQSAMSNALTRLRRYFDDPLLIQIGRRMELTPRAEAIRGQVRDILVRIEATIDASPVFDPAATEREFAVLMSDYTLTVLMPHVLALAEAAGARAQFRLLPQMDKPFIALERGEADLLVTPVQLCSDNHPSEHLFFDEFVCLVWSEGPHAGKPLTAEAYCAAEHVSMTPPNHAHSLEKELLIELGVDRREAVRCFSFSALPQLVAGTGLIATVHGCIARAAAAHLPLEVHPLPFDIGRLDQSIQWHSYRAADPGVIWLRDLFRQAGRRLTETGAGAHSAHQ